MDKIKDFGFLVFKKHLFWTLGTVVLIMGVVAWWMAAGQLAAEYKTNKDEVEGAHTKIQAVAGKPEDEIFNEGTETGMQAENTRRAKEVYLAWREKYVRQRRDVLVWPDGLSQPFIRAVEGILDGRPIEEITLTPKNDLIKTHREEFRDQINELLPQLAEMINSKWEPTAAASSGTRGGRGGPTRGPIYSGNEGRGGPNSGTVDEEPLAVRWDPSNQGQIVADHFNFYEDERSAPSTVQILYAMEDYWVLKALMQIIARTNTTDGALSHRRDLSAIRDIESIQIGKSVDAGAGGQIYRLASSSDEAENAEGQATGGANTGSPRGAEGEGVEFGAGAEQVKEFAEGRYVDKLFNPLKAETLKTAATGKNKDDAYLAVAKRMPVRMRVKMDQRKLNKFLVECGNGDLMLEVVQVRINPDGSDVISLAGGTSSGTTGNRGFGGRQTPQRGGFRPGVGGGTADRGSPDGKTEPWDVIVEVYGIIYIFNPPSIERLELSVEDQQKLDAVDLEDADAAQAAAAEPSEGAPAGTGEADDGETLPGGTDDPANDEPATTPTEEPPADGTPPAAAATPEDAARTETPAAVGAG